MRLGESFQTQWQYRNLEQTQNHFNVAAQKGVRISPTSNRRLAPFNFVPDTHSSKGSKMPDSRETSVHELFDLYRKYIVHEDDLINQRTTWLLLAQSFLMATFGFTYQKKLEVAGNLLASGKNLSIFGPISDQFNTFLLILAVIGALLAVCGFASIYAAMMALRKLRAQWLRINQDAPPAELPGLTGAGDDLASRLGIAISAWTPVFFFLMWITAIFTLLFVLKIAAR